MGDRRRTPALSGHGLAAVVATSAVALSAAGCAGSGSAVEVPGASVSATSIAASNDTATDTATGSTSTSTPTSSSAPTSTTSSSTSPTTAAPTSTSTVAAVPAEPPPPTPPPTVEDPFLRIGDDGPRVTRMQLQLQALGYLDPGYDEGLFDRATADALIDFQAQYGLVVDGIFGPETDRSLSAAAASVDPDA